MINEYTREVHTLHVSRSIGANQVREVMERLTGKYGDPAYIRSDNGPEFIAKSLGKWLQEEEIKTLYIDSGSRGRMDM